MPAGEVTFAEGGAEDEAGIAAEALQTFGNALTESRDSSHVPRLHVNPYVDRRVHCCNESTKRTSATFCKGFLFRREFSLSSSCCGIKMQTPRLAKRLAFSSLEERLT